MTALDSSSMAWATSFVGGGEFTSGKDVDFVVAPLFGTQVLAMLPVALEYKMPILAPTGTGPVTEQGNPYMFRLYPSDAISKVAHIRYVVDELKLKKAAILYNTTGYGQSGFKYMSEYLAKAGGAFTELLDRAAH